MKTQSQNASELADLAEDLRQRGKLKEAWGAVKNSLEKNANHPRTRLLLARLLYQDGKILEALEALRPLGSVLGDMEELKDLNSGLERLRQLRQSAAGSSFVTETMARLLAEQGYLLEAIEIYRQLYLASAGESRLWGEILLLRERLKREGSREYDEEKVAQEVEALEQWIQQQEREL